jgi:two-component system, chemotaxis family, response regulator PixG
MTSTAWPNVSVLSQQLGDCEKQQFSGMLSIWAGGSQQWQLYFCLGRIIWAAGGKHPNRRWLRLINHYCPHLNFREQQLQEIDTQHCGDYDYLIQLVRQHEGIGQQVARIIRDNITEVLFDILQQESFGPLSFKVDNRQVLDTSVILMKGDQALGQTYQEWQAWCNVGLSKLSPNMAPVIRDAKRLSEELSATTYQNLVQFVDGTHTLRDIALKTGQELPLLTQAFRLYVRKHLLDLVSIPDLLSPGQPFSWAQTDGVLSTPHLAVEDGPMIAHVDDNPAECKRMRAILTGSSYRYLGIQNSVMALPTLLESKPDLIFLDLMMPVVNGFELCAQIRKTTALRDVPVIFITSNDGIFDRVRAKLVRCTSYINKPIEHGKVWSVVKEQLATQKTEQVISTF